MPAKFKLRSRYEVCGVVYRVVESSDVPDCADAEVCFHSHVIRIRPGLTVHDRKVALIHELLHALWYEMKWYNFEISKDAEEVIVDSIAEYVAKL